MAETYRLPNEMQFAELLYQQTKANLKDAENLSELEKEIGARFVSRRNGKIFGRKIYHFASNTTSTCEALKDTVGLTATPSTDKVDGTDDFVEASEIFTWQHCNYVPDEDGTKRLVTLEGMPGYTTEGSVDVGTIAPTFWWKMEKHATYDIIFQSDTPHPELGLVPWKSAVKADNTVLPYYIESSYPSVIGSDGLLHSQPGSAPAYNNSYQNIITNYAKKGTGYFGAGIGRQLHGYIFNIIKYGQKSVGKNFAGCTNFNIQVPCAVAESGVKRVLTTNANFYVGCCVSVGTGTAVDRNLATCHDIVNRAKVLSIETVVVNETSYYALNLDIDDTIDTLTTYYITSMPCFAGETDAVPGIKDGSYLSNTNARHTCRIHGVEYMWGQYVVASDTMLDHQGDYWNVYTAPRGVAHRPNDHTGYKLVGKIPYNNGIDVWMGDFTVDHETGAYNPSALGTGDSVGVGDRTYEGGTNVKDGTLRQLLMLGGLGHGSDAGFCYVACGLVLSRATWSFASCD